MARIFLVLALFDVALLLTNLAVGWTTGDFGGTTQRVVELGREKARLDRSPLSTLEQREAADEAYQQVRAEFDPLQRHKQIHVWFGIGITLLTMLVNAVSVTYFIGTSRWCREVVETFHFDLDLARRSAQLKRRTFALALLSMLTILCVAAFGALSDPTATANFESASQWVSIHFIVAILGTAFIAWSFYVQVINIGAHYEIIEQIMLQVGERRGTAETVEAAAAEQS